MSFSCFLIRKTVFCSGSKQIYIQTTNKTCIIIITFGFVPLMNAGSTAKIYNSNAFCSISVSISVWRWCEKRNGARGEPYKIMIIILMSSYNERKESWASLLAQLKTLHCKGFFQLGRKQNHNSSFSLLHTYLNYFLASFSHMNVTMWCHTWEYSFMSKAFHILQKILYVHV